MRTLFAVLALLLSNFSYSAEFPDRIELPDSLVQRANALSDDEMVHVGDLVFSAIEIKSGIILPRRWPNGRVPIAFDSSVSTQQRDLLFSACGEWGQGTAIRCVPRTAEPDYVLVVTHNGSGCRNLPTSCSYLGMRGGQQLLEMHINQWGDGRTIQHELGHALGAIHEQSRSDRDSFVAIQWANVIPEAAGNFEIYKGATPTTDYDYTSIMHYSRCAWSRYACSIDKEHTQTIVPRACHVTGEFGGASISTLDLEGVRRAYGGALANALQAERVQSCGVQAVSPSQARHMCGGDCGSAATATTHIRVEQKYRSWCGVATVPPPQSECQAMGKEYIRHWMDEDPFSCGTPLPVQTRGERWTECGCSVQTLTLSCTDIRHPAEEAVIDKMMASSDSIDVQGARLMRYMTNHKDWMNLGEGTRSGVTTFLLENRSSVKADRALSRLRFRLRIASMLSWVVGKPGLTDSRLIRYSSRYGLDTSAIAPDEKEQAK